MEGYQQGIPEYSHLTYSSLPAQPGGVPSTSASGGGEGSLSPTQPATRSTGDVKVDKNGMPKKKRKQVSLHQPFRMSYSSRSSAALE